MFCWVWDMNRTKPSLKVVVASFSFLVLGCPFSYGQGWGNELPITDPVIQAAIPAPLVAGVETLAKRDRTDFESVITRAITEGLREWQGFE